MKIDDYGWVVIWWGNRLGVAWPFSGGNRERFPLAPSFRPVDSQGIMRWAAISGHTPSSREAPRCAPRTARAVTSPQRLSVGVPLRGTLRYKEVAKHIF